MGCGSCGAKNGGTVEQRFVWVSDDGTQKVSNLSRVQAQTRQNRKGGVIQPQSA